MGFYYLLVLLIGIMLFIMGLLKKDVSKDLKLTILYFIFGIIFIGVSLVLLLPGSSEVIAILLGN